MTVGSGKIVYTLGNPTIINNAQWSYSSQPKITVKQLLQHNSKTLDIEAKYMHDKLSQKADVAADRIFNITKNLCMKVFGGKTEEHELSHVDVHTQETVKTVGTIYSDYDGALDSASTLLVGTDIMMCRTVRLNFSKMKSVAVFPGQVVMVSGINPRGDVFMVEELFAEQQLMMPSPPRLAEQLSFVVAAGPFTNDDDLVYDPLQDLVTYLKENKPNILILTGPFLDANHKLIKNDVILAETYEMFFEKIIDGIIDTVGTDTVILVVASSRDVHADPVYPTIPMTLSKNYPNVYLLPDPSLIDLNGLTIGLTSTDIMDHILSQELAVNAGDKVKRAVNYLFHQKSFYPLSPPIENTINFDSDLASKFTNIEEIPNIIILPSDQKCFLRLVNGCLAINPGRLADVNVSGGTFARFIITPPGPKEENNPFSYIGCQVRKV
uniref:DNA polymerase alpha subunit B n=1 Tax=Glossina brevipalpis TaxID=37001 RepID=A0A1A9WU78_9MUSC